MKAAVIVFPGSNCDRDMLNVLGDVFGDGNVDKIWHTETNIDNKYDLIALPGGFSYGDYLRSGAISAKSPIMTEIKKQATRGVKVFGVCNGFQVLTESGLLDGSLIRNKNLKFICKDVELSVENNNSVFTNKYQLNQKINIPIAHHDGSYFARDDTIKALQDNEQIAFKYIDNPNGSVADIAGIFNKQKNILGMMPHPERAYNKITGNTDGRALFESILSF